MSEAAAARLTSPSLTAPAWPWVLLLGLPFLVHWPALIGWLNPDPIYRESGLGMSKLYGLPHGLPGFNDPNAGLTTQALGALATRQWLSGEIPWWNPFNGVGLPLAAEMQSSSLFLPFILLLGLPQGVLLLKIAMQIVGGLSTFALLRQLKLLPLSAAVGGALFELNGVFAWTAHAPMLPVAFLPLFLLGIERARAEAIEGVKPRHWWGASGWRTVAIALAFSLYAGFPETAYLDGILALVWAGFRLATLPNGRIGFTVRVATGGIIGIILAAPLLLPFAQFLSLSELGVRESTNMNWLGQLATGFAQYLFPYIYGQITAFTADDPTQELLHLWGRSGGYAGMTLFFVAALAVASGQRERGLRLLLAVWIVLAIAKTGAVPGIKLIFDYIPMMNSIQFFRYAPPTWLMAMIILASFALDDYIRGEVINRNRRWIVALFCAFMAALSLIAAYPLIALLDHNTPYYFRYVVFALLWGGATFVVAIILFFKRERRPMLLAAFLIFDASIMFALPLLAGTREPKLNMGPVEFLQKNLGLQRFYSLSTLLPNYSAYFGVAAINSDYQPVPLAWTRYIHNSLDPASDVTYFSGNFLPDLPLHISALRANLAAYRMLGVKYVLSHSDVFPFDQRIEPKAASGAVMPMSLPAGTTSSGTIPSELVKPGTIEAFGVRVGTFVGQSTGPLSMELCTMRACASGAIALDQASDNQIATVDLQTALPVEAGDSLHYRIAHASGVNVAIWLHPSSDQGMQFTGPVSIPPGLSPKWMLRYRPDAPLPPVVYKDPLITIYELPDPAPYFEVRGGPCRLTADGRRDVLASCDASASLIRREMAFPGWRVTLNGTEKPLTTVEPFFQEVQLPAGDSQLHYAYSPPGIGWTYGGFWLGVLSLFAPGFFRRFGNAPLRSRANESY